MTPEQKIKWLILELAAKWKDQEPPTYPCENVDDLYESLVENDEHWDAIYEIRSGDFETDLPVPYSRHYEAKAVATELPDKSWVGWTYWYGGGKHAEPEAIDWIEDAYDVSCKEEEQTLVVRTFSVIKAEE